MNTELKHTIKNRFPHIEFSSDREREEWFFETLLPLLVLKWMNGIEGQEDGSGFYDTRILSAIKEDFRRWMKETYLRGFPPLTYLKTSWVDED